MAGILFITVIVYHETKPSGYRVEPVLQSRKQVIRSYFANINTVSIGVLKSILTFGNHQGINAKIAADKALKPYSQSVGFRCCAIIWQYRNYR